MRDDGGLHNGRFWGKSWPLDGVMSIDNQRDTYLPPEQRRPMSSRDEKVDFRIGSAHPGGSIFAFLDGHSQFLRNDIDLTVLRAISTIDGGEVINANDLSSR